MTGERVARRLAAILAADVVGYSRLMGRDEHGTLTRLKAHRTERFEPTLARHGGRLVKLIGDGALAEFPSAVDALGAAIEFQQAMADANAGQPEDTAIVFRIGLHLGDLIVDGDDLYGDGVNVAARLEAEAPAGGIVVSRTVHESVAGRLKADFADLGNLALKNIERPIQAFRVAWQAADWQAAVSTPSTVAALLPAEVALALTDKPSVAVLPFQNMSGDPEQEYFADGISEDIITALSKWRSFLVIARNSTFTYKGRNVDIRQVGRELGVRYVLEGSVRKAANRLRITAQLIDATTAAHIWAERYDRDLTDVFAIQDEISGQIAAVVEPELGRYEQGRASAKAPASLEAWDCLHRGMYLLYKFTKTDIAASRPYFERAIELDPLFSRAHTSLAYTHQLDILHGYTDDRARSIEWLLSHAKRGVQLDDNDSYGHLMLCFAYRWAGEHDLAVAEGRKAIAINPSDTWALGVLGNVLDLAGQSREGLACLERALALSPRDPHAKFYLALCARASIVIGDYAGAESWAGKAIGFDPSIARPYFMLASALGHLGRTKQARAALDTCERVQPGFAALWIRWQEYRSAADNAHVIDGLRKAGMPE